MLVFKRPEGSVIPITITTTGDVVFLHILAVSRGGKSPKVKLGLDDPNRLLSIPIQGTQTLPDEKPFGRP